MVTTDQLIERGNSAFERFDYIESVNMFKEAVAHLETSSDSQQFCHQGLPLHIKIGWGFIHLGEWDMALESFKETAEKSLALNFPSGLGQALIGEGWVHLYRGDLTTADDKVHSAKQALESVKDNHLICQINLLAGTIASRQGKMDSAEANLRANITILEDPQGGAIAGDPKLLSRTYCQMALIEFRKGNLENAPFFAQRALDILHGGSDCPEKGEAYRYLGAIRSEQGELNEALQLHAKALSQFFTSCSVYGQGKTYNSLGQTYMLLEELDHSLFFYEKSLAIYQKLSITHEIGALYGKMGHVHMIKEDFKAAEEYYLKDLLVTMEMEDTHNMAYLSRNVGRIFFLRKDYDQAISHYRKAVALFKRGTDELGVAVCKLELAKAIVNDGNLSQAIDLATSAMEVFSRKNYEFGQSEAHFLLGILKRISKECPEALQHFRKAQVFADKTRAHSRKAKIFLEMGLTNKSMANNDAAIQFLLKALDESKRSRMLHLTARILERLAEVDITSIVVHSTEEI